MTDDKIGPDTARVRPQRKQWNYIPELPIQVSPLFSGRLRPKAIIKWFVGGWFPISENLVILMLSIISWFFFHPGLVRCQVFQFDWIAQIFIKNLALMFLVAGGLHLYFYVYRKQGEDRHYDARPLAKSSSGPVLVA
jgi:hypothetical protein